MIWAWVTAAVVLDGAVALVGGLLPDRWLMRHRPTMLGFAAGALLAAAVLDLVPDALDARGVVVVPWLAASIVALAALDYVFGVHGHHHEQARNPVAYGLLASDAVHNFGDGIAIAAAFLSSTHLGVITSIAVLVHELPEELADYAVLRVARVGKRRSLVALALVQLTAGVGAAVTLLGATLGHGHGHSIVLAIAGGTFIYIALVELMPDILREGSRRDRLVALASFAAGAVLIALV